MHFILNSYFTIKTLLINIRFRLLLHAKHKKRYRIKPLLVVKVLMMVNCFYGKYSRQKRMTALVI